MNEIVVSGKKNAYIKKILIKFLISNLFGWLIYILGAFADSILGGIFLGEEALAGIEIVTPLFTIIYFFAYLISIGASYCHANEIGNNNFEKADSIFSSGFYISIIFSIVIAGLLFILKEPILKIYNLSDEIYLYASDYYDPCIWFALICPIGTYLYEMAVSDGAIAATLYCDFAEALLNIGLSLILVQSIGVKGLAISTFLASLIAHFFIVGHFFTKKNTCHLKPVFNMKDVGRAAKLSLSTACATLGAAVVDIVMNLFICVQFGAGFTAPYAIVNFALQISGALIFVGSGMACLMNVSVGEKNHIDIVANRNYSIKLGVIVSIGFSAFFIGLTPIWPSVFGMETVEFIELTKFASITIGVSFIFATFMYIINSYYTSFEKMTLPVISNILHEFALPIILPVILSFPFGYKGFIVGFALTAIITLAIIVTYLLIKNKGKIFLYTDDIENEYSIDFNFDNESISNTAKSLENVLKERNIEASLINEIEVMIEDALVVILKRNKHPKLMSGRLIVIFKEHNISIIEKDNGQIFNLSDPDNDIRDISDYVYNAMSTIAKTKVNYLAVATNSNHFEFDI